MKLHIHSQTQMLQPLKFGGMDKLFHPLLFWVFDNLFMLKLKLNQVGKWNPQ